MKKMIVTALACLSLMACSQPLTTNSKTVQPYGIINEDAVKDNNICYSVPAANIILGIIFIETVIVPIYIVGWDLFEPIKEKTDGKCN